MWCYRKITRITWLETWTNKQGLKHGTQETMVFQVIKLELVSAGRFSRLGLLNIEC